MAPRLAPWLLLVCTACGSSTTPAQPDATSEPTADPKPDLPPEHDAWNLDEPGPLQVLCKADSKELAEARALYDALEASAEALTLESPTEDFQKASLALYRHPCLRVARIDESGETFEFENGLDAKTHWDDGLGMWFRTYLDLAAGTDTTVWLMPTRRDIVTPKTRPEDPLAPWLCPADDEGQCAQAVSGWRSRAERYYALWANAGKPETVDCRETLDDGPAEDAYGRWRDCEEAQVRRHDALPVGGLGEIEQGWLVVYGRRGHYQYCDELAALDLKTGSHYRFAQCEHRPELDGLQEAGAIEPPPEGVLVEVGTVPAELLREAAWATLSVRYVQRDVVTERALGRQLPEGVAMQRRHDAYIGGLGLSGIGSSGGTTLGWIWARGAGPSKVFGELSWPTGLSDPAEDHAVRLLSVAESRHEDGCAPAELPGWLAEAVTATSLPKSDLVDPPSEAILSAMRRQMAKGRCG